VIASKREKSFRSKKRRKVAVIFFCPSGRGGKKGKRSSFLRSMEEEGKGGPAKSSHKRKRRHAFFPARGKRKGDPACYPEEGKGIRPLLPTDSKGRKKNG